MPAERPVPVLHVGYHKTGSSWLQRILWNRRDAGFVQPSSVQSIRDTFVRVHPYRFDPAAAAAGHPGVAAALDGGLVPVLADERLSGHPHSGGYDGRAIADRLHATFPSAVVVIVIREQRRVVLSCWKQYVKTGGPMPLHRYLTPPTKGFDRIPLFRFEHFEYDRLIAHYQARFGPEHVLVLPYEHLAAERDRFLDRVASFTGTRVPDDLQQAPENPSTSVLASDLKRRTNWLVARDATNPRTLVDSQPLAARATRVTNRIARRAPAGLRHRREHAAQATVSAACAGRYAESNRRTAALTGLDLTSLGYEG